MDQRDRIASLGQRGATVNPLTDTTEPRLRRKGNNSGRTCIWFPSSVNRYEMDSELVT